MSECPHALMRARAPDGRCPLCGPPEAEPEPLPAAVAEADPERLWLDVRAEKMRRSLALFLREGWHVLEPGVELEWSWHIEEICEHVQRALFAWRDGEAERSGRARNLIVNVPPGSLKSRILSVYAPAWVWTWDPTWSAICLSANPSVAQRDARLSRELLASEWYRRYFQPEWRIKDDQDAISNFGNTAGGSRQSKGLNAKVTGERADAILVDDPHDAAEALSDVKRQAVIDRWDHSVENRVNDERKAVRILIMQRVHEGDLSGHLLEQGGWHHLCLPMEFEPHRADPVDRRTQPGELLHPERFTAEICTAKKRKLGSFGYAGQYQQAPAPVEGGLFKRRWWRWFKLEGTGAHPAWQRPMGCNDLEAVTLSIDSLEWIIISLDAAFRKTEDGSRVSFLVIGARGADRFVLENVTRPMDFNETCQEMRRLHAKYPKALRKLVEARANGDAVVNRLHSTVPGLIPVEPEGGKEARAAAVSPEVESGNVYLLEGAEWADDFVTELGLFPNGRRDDQVDALSQGLTYMTRSPAAARAATLLSR